MSLTPSTWPVSFCQKRTCGPSLLMQLFGNSFKWVFMNESPNAHFVNFISYEGFDYEHSALSLIPDWKSNEFKP
jgi:hypothetical protein